VQKKTNSAFDIESVKDPELRGYLQHLTNSLNRQNQELRALVLKDKILDGYFHSESLQESLDLAVKEFKMPGCSSLRILVRQNEPFAIAHDLEAIAGDHAQEYAYLDEQIIQQLQEKDQQVINDTSKVHTIKFTPEVRYPRAIGALRFLFSNDLAGYVWVSFEAVKEFTTYELDKLTQFGSILDLICTNSMQITVNRDKAMVYQKMLALLDVPVVFLGGDKKVSYANACAEKIFKGNFERLCSNPVVIDWLESSQKALRADIEIADKHYQLSGEKIDEPGFPREAFAILADDTAINRKQAYLTLMMDTINHDFRGSLVNMQGFSKLLGMVGELNPKQREYLQLIQDGIEEIATVTTDLLDVKRMIQEGGLKVQECSPQELIEKALTLIQAEARQKQVTFESRLTSKDQTVLVDRILVVSAFYQLLKQAIQNSHLGGSISIAEELVEDKWVVSVQDAGRGISQIDIENLAQNHFADKNSPGLSLVYRIARFHQGDMRVESELGKGTKFILQLTGCD
jgi:nitrogen-specific signal transduction histidine kinase